MPNTLLDTSVYIHFPWCAKKCPYCDFASTQRSHADIPHEAYADAVIEELARRGPYEGRQLVSIFFGGGTPSMWRPASVRRVIDAILRSFDVHSTALEISAECNPNSLSADVAKGFADAGIGRLSIGVQSLANDTLQYLGRLHDRDEALGAIEIALAHMPRVSADLMFGMPRQKRLHSEIEAVIATGVQHVSAYALTIEPGTQFGERHKQGKLEVATDERYASLFEEAEARFHDAGFEHYEVSNYARPGQESRHNQHYWKGGDYLGLGAAAVGCLSGDTPVQTRATGDLGPTARRYKNTIRPEHYLDASYPREHETETLDAQDRIRESLMLGLRTTRGVHLGELAQRAGCDPRAGRETALDARMNSGDLVIDDQVLRIPRSRWLLLDGIVTDIF